MAALTSQARTSEVKLTNEELAALRKSAAAVRELVDVMAPKLSLVEPAAMSV